LHFSLVVYLIIDLAKFWLPIITLKGLFKNYLKNALSSLYIYFPYLKKLGWGALYFCSGALVVVSPLDFYYSFWL
jgi:hypothetical protein